MAERADFRRGLRPGPRTSHYRSRAGFRESSLRRGFTIHQIEVWDSSYSGLSADAVDAIDDASLRWGLFLTVGGLCCKSEHGVREEPGDYLPMFLSRRDGLLRGPRHADSDRDQIGNAHVDANRTGLLRTREKARAGRAHVGARGVELRILVPQPGRRTARAHSSMRQRTSYARILDESTRLIASG